MEDFDFVIPKLDKKFTDSIKKKILDVSYYGGSDSCKMDIYFPNESKYERAPLIAYFHGGAFMKGTRKDDALEPMLRGLERGFIVASIDYRLSNEARFPAMILDGKCAIRFLRCHADEYGIDASRIALWGPSSGGYLVSMMGVSDKIPGLEDLTMGYSNYSSKVQAVVDWCGPVVPFSDMDEFFRNTKKGIPDHDLPISPESRFLGAPIKEVKELCRLAAPITYVDKNCPYFCIFHGEDDQVVPVQCSQLFAEKIQSVSSKDHVQIQVVPQRKHHGDPWYHEKWVSDTCLDFLVNVLYGGKENGRS